MFKRRREKKYWEKFKHWIYPESGYKRTASYWFHRLIRLNASPESLSAGVASGVAVSFTPFMGFHLAGGWLLCLISRGNPVAMIIGSLIGNPWTFPFIWLGIYKFGNLFTGMADKEEHAAKLSFELIKESPMEIFLPMTVGGLIIAAVAWPVSYYAVMPIIRKYQHHRRERISKGKFNLINRLRHKNIEETK